MDSGNTGTAKRKQGRPKGSKNKKGLGHKNKGYTVSEKALAQRRTNGSNNPMKVPAKTEEERAINAGLIEHIMRINEIATHADRNDILSLKSCFIAYLKLCQEDGFKVGNMAAYAAMGLDHAQFTLLSKKDDPETRQFVKLVKQTCAMFRETNVAEGTLNPVIGIFWQRNYDGLRNDTEQIQSINEMQEEQSNKGYKEKYRNLIGD